MFGLILTLAPIVALLIAFAWGIFIGIRNVRIRFIGVAVSFIFALIAAILVKNVSYSVVHDALTGIGGGSGMLNEVLTLLGNSEILSSSLVSFGGAFLAPLVFCIAFVVCAIVTWIIGWIVSLILSFVMKKSEGKRIDAWWRVLIYATVQVMLTFFVILTPIAVYGDFISTAADVAEGAEIKIPFVDANELKKTADDVDSSLVVKAYKVTGGNLFCKGITSFKVGNAKTNIPQEIDAIGTFAGNIFKLTSHKITEYGEDDAELIREIGESFNDSLLITTLTGEIIHIATDAWIDDNDETKFLGKDKPQLEGSKLAMFSDAVDHILIALNGDSTDSNALRADIETIANIVVILAEDEVFSQMGGEGTTALINSLSSGSTVKKLVEELGANPSFKILIGDITNIGMRAIGTTLKIPENSEAVYSRFTDRLASDINSIKTAEKSHDEKIAELANAIAAAFAESGNSLKLEGDAMKLYAETLLADFESYDSVSANDVEEFFRVYAEVSNSLSADKLKLCSATIRTLDNDTYSGSAYAGKSIEELKKTSGAGLLAQIMKDIVVASVTCESDEAFSTAAKEIIKNSYVAYAEATGKDTSKADELVASIEIAREEITEESISKTESMSSSEELGKVSVVVTIEKLLVDAEEAANSLDSAEAIQKEAEAIQSIFGSAGDIVVKLDSSDAKGLDLLTEITDSLGSALDSLSITNTVGEEQTAILLTAVFQSETVRDAADLDIESATELAQEVTKPNEDGTKTSYKDTMNSVSAGANVVNKLKDENSKLEEDDVRELLDNMTPSTAGMIKVYMTEKRVASMGVPSSRVPRATQMIRNLLDEMAEKDKYADTYDQETKGILKLFNIVIAAKNSDNSTKILFNSGDTEGRLGITAEECMFDLLDSRMASNAIIKTLKTDTGYENDPFGLKVKKDSSDYIAVRNAIDSYYSAQSVKDDYLNQRIAAIEALIGISE